MRFLLEMDVPEPRVKYDRLVASVDGTDDGWDTLVGTDVYLCPITRMLMLMPLPFTKEWDSESTGAYARLRKADYDLTVARAANFNDHPVVANAYNNPGNYYLDGSDNDPVQTIASYPPNQPWYVSNYCYGTATSRAVMLECGWGTATTGVKLSFTADGQVDIFKANVKIATYSLGNRNANNGKAGGANRQSFAAAFNDFVLIPCRGRELLVYSASKQGGFSHIFEDLPDLAPGLSPVQNIVPAGKFWWRVPAGKATVQAVPLRFKTAGFAFGKVNNLPYAPAAGRTFNAIPAWHPAGFGTQNTQFDLVNGNISGGATAFVPDGTKRAVRVRAALTGDGFSTPFVYAGDMVSAPVLTTTANAPFNLTPYLTELTLRVDEKGTSTLRFGVASEQELIAAGFNRPAVIGDRPVRLAIVNEDGSTVDIFRGTADAPDREWEEGMAASQFTGLLYTAECRSKQFRLCQFRNTLPYDGLPFTDSMQDIAGYAGVPAADADVTADTLVLPYTPAVSGGEWQYIPDRGDTVQDWLDKLKEQFAANWFTGWYPTKTRYKWRLRSPASLPTASVVNLYTRINDAVLGGYELAFARFRTIQKLRYRTVPAEANQVTIIGWQRLTRKYITAQYDDSASQNPELAPAARPTNWRGQVVSYQLLDPMISTQAGADRARDVIQDRLTHEIEYVDFQSDFLVRQSSDALGVPVWVGDRITTHLPGSVTETWQVLSFFMQVVREVTDNADLGLIVRPTQYTAVCL